MFNGNFHSAQNLDLTRHRLIHDGPLSWKLGDTRRIKTVDLHVVLLEDCIMLLQKQDDKYLLKFHTSSAATNAAAATSGSGGLVGGLGGSKFVHSPIIKFSTMLVRPVATGEGDNLLTSGNVPSYADEGFPCR